MIRMTLMLLLLSGTAHAETMYRCVGKGGAVSYQDYPCEKGAKMTGAVEFMPERVPAYRPPQQIIPPRALNVGSPLGAHVPMQRNPSACDSAKAYREQTLRQVGLRRTYELLQRLDENVRVACK
jgi:hypothetical protein